MSEQNLTSNWRDYFTGARYLFHTLPSTQQFLRAHEPNLHPIFCRALKQTHGQGQREREWQQLGEALLFSCSITLPGELSLQQGLTQAIALALVGALDPNKAYLQVKWPNDIYHQQRKLAGILVEGSPHPLDDSRSQLIIGVGINVAQDNVLDGRQTANDTAAFWQEIKREENSESLLARIMPAFIDCIEDWAQRPYLPLDHAWDDYDCYRHKMVHLVHQSTPMQVLGIDQKGRLLCRDKQNTLHYLTNTRIIGNAG